MPRRWAEETGSVELREWLDHFAESRAKGIRDEQLGILGNADLVEHLPTRDAWRQTAPAEGGTPERVSADAADGRAGPR